MKRAKLFRNILQREGKGSAAAGLGEKDQTQDNMREQFWKDSTHTVIEPTNNALRDMVEDGTLEELFAKWWPADS